VKSFVPFDDPRKIHRAESRWGIHCASEESADPESREIGVQRGSCYLDFLGFARLEKRLE
jgi:hypothetical protein